MLIEAIHHMKNVTSAYGKIYGQKNNLATSSIARMNLFLNGANDFHIAQGDMLCNPRFFDDGKLKTFDCVVAKSSLRVKELRSGNLQRGYLWA